MHPFLFDFLIFGHHLRIPTYGFLLATSFSTGYVFALKRAIKLNISPKHVENFFLIAVLGSILGARLFHVLFEEFDYYSSHPDKILAIWSAVRSNVFKSLP